MESAEMPWQLCEQWEWSVTKRWSKVRAPCSRTNMQRLMQQTKSVKVIHAAIKTSMKPAS